ncbi:MAG: type II secretion system protein [Candidatus Hydrogenedentes bacterium]|nr:type II secretion system protein [Candidatus Hydrogenedentota bacterium]
MVSQPNGWMRFTPVCASRRAGFTLIELAFVTGLIVLVLAIAMPRLMPVFAFSQLEGSARHLANYGRAAIAYSAFKQEPITFRYNFETNEYCVLRWIEKQESIFEGSDLAVENQPLEINVETALNLASQQGLSPEERAAQVQDFEYQLDLSFRRSLEARVKNVPRDGLLAGINPLEEFEFSLDEEEEEEREELTTSTLMRTAFPPDVRIVAIRMGDEEYVKGVVDVEITPVGISDAVAFVLQSTDGDTFRVEWDAITGGAHLARGEGVEP